MGRSVVVRDSYVDEARKLNWMEESIVKDRRISPGTRSDVLPLIARLRESLLRIELEIKGANVSGP